MKLVNAISDALQGDLPGAQSHDKMMRARRPSASESLTNGSNPRMSAVLMLLYPRASVLHTALILRPSYDGVHSAQVSFPGGKMEDEDSSLEMTALRETHEEIGVPGTQVELLGSLTPLYIPPSNFHVSPFIGSLTHEPNLVPDRKEVERIFEIPVEELLRLPVLEKDLYLPKYKATFPISYFDVDGEVVWGATAMILAEFRDLLSNHNI